MKKIYCYIILLIFISCNLTEQKNLSKIEIYLVKDRIETTRGISIFETDLDSIKVKYNSKKMNFDIVRYDTLTHDYIFAGPFKSEKSNLEKTPFIFDSELIKFNRTKNIFMFDSEATKRISKLDKNGSYGKQFVLTIDGIPELNGYFYNPAFTYGCHTNHLMQYDKNSFELLFDIEYKNVNFQAKFPKLYNVLKTTNRIVSK